MFKIEIVRLMNVIIENGFESVLSESNYNCDELLKLMYQSCKKKILDKELENKILSVLNQQLAFKKYSFQDQKIGFLADTHIGNQKENWEYIKRAYERFNMEGIDNVFLLGNIFEGCSSNEDLKSKKAIMLSQVSELETNYPNGFQTYVVFGESDKSFSKLNLRKALLESREDIIPMSFESGYARWNNNSIALKHRVLKEEIPSYMTECNFNLCGHAHYYQYLPEYATLKIPTCSDVHPNNRFDKQYTPGFIILENKEKKILAHRYIFEGNETKHALRRVIKKNN